MDQVRTSFSFWAVVATVGLSACGSSSTDSGFLLEGVWQTNVTGDRQTTLELAGDDTFTLVEVDFAQQDCITERGTWLVDDGGLVVTTTEIDGQPANQVQRLPFTLSAETLRITAASGVEVLMRIAQMVDCASYGLP